ncbi:MAG TPA: hypothetical protein VEX36_11215 [Thermoleophilaceae bacterium]|nr:hypothetical protein [Thermoleophilaceae bacterium]
MTTWQLLVLAWGVGAPLAVAGFVLSYPVYLRHRRQARFGRSAAVVRPQRRHSLRRTV